MKITVRRRSSEDKFYYWVDTKCKSFSPATLSTNLTMLVCIDVQTGEIKFFKPEDVVVVDPNYVTGK